MKKLKEPETVQAQKIHRQRQTEAERKTQAESYAARKINTWMGMGGWIIDPHCLLNMFALEEVKSRGKETNQWELAVLPMAATAAVPDGIRASCLR
jgi:hypothetical protein